MNTLENPSVNKANAATQKRFVALSLSYLLNSKKIKAIAGLCIVSVMLVLAFLTTDVLVNQLFSALAVLLGIATLKLLTLNPSSRYEK